MDRLRSLYQKYREIISYVFWGAITTIVNISVYFLASRLLCLHYLVSNVLAWTAGVIFAFFVNKVFVFRSRDWSAGTAFRELWQMAASRIFSGVVETLILLVFVDFLHCNDTVIKLIANVIVVIINYVLSKWVVFKK